jgi:hypothetical protein
VRACPCIALHAGGKLAALAVAGIDTDLSIVQTPGVVLPVSWIDVPNVDPGEDEASVREQVILAGATPIQKAEGVWTDHDGSVWFVASRATAPTRRTKRIAAPPSTPGKSGNTTRAATPWNSS